jgi:hypothetical protein
MANMSELSPHQPIKTPSSNISAARLREIRASGLTAKEKNITDEVGFEPTDGD